MKLSKEDEEKITVLLQEKIEKATPEELDDLINPKCKNRRKYNSNISKTDGDMIGCTQFEPKD